MTELTIEQLQEVHMARIKECVRLEDEIERLSTEHAAKDKAINQAASLIGFFSAVIKSGEPWTDQCENMRERVLELMDASVSGKQDD